MFKTVSAAIALALLAFVPAQARQLFHMVHPPHHSRHASKVIAFYAKGVHPALWTVHGPKGTAYLFGSIHVLPPNIPWQRPEILSAMKRADIFVFEIPLDHQDKDREEAQKLQKAIMDEHGLLPPGMSLRAQLPADAVPKYDHVIADLNISPGYIDRLQPWLASTVLETAQFFRSDARALNGVDVQVFAIADGMHKPSQGFETLEEQLAILTPEEQKVGVAELSHAIDEATKAEQMHTFDDIVADWEHGDIAAIGRESDKEFAKDPALRKVILDNRNTRFAAKLKTMLDQPKVYFVTVGAAHLAGPDGVPELMRAAGYKVDGPVDHTAMPPLRPSR